MKRTNKIYLGLVIVIIPVFMISCQKNLDQIPQTSISDANFWKTTNDLSLACNYLYSYLPGLGTSDPSGNPYPYQDENSEIAYNVNGPNSISNGSRLAPATSGEWSGYYRLIRAANNIMEKSVTVTGDQSIINKYLGEARFFRALGYFELVKRFGDVPYINKILTTSDSLLYSARTPREAVIDSIYADLDFAAANCPMPDAQASAEYGRITSTAATAFKSRVALFEGTWDKFHAEGDASKHLQIAIDASSAVMSSGKHNLFTYAAQPDSSYYYLFQYQNAASQQNYTYSTNHEIILARLYGQNPTNNISSHSYVRGSVTDAGIAATRGFINMYDYKDGLPVGKSPYDSSLMETSTLTQFQNRDPRMGMTIMDKNDWYPSITGIHLYQPGLIYHTRKYATILDFTANQSFVNFLVIRYAEVLLNYAEAKFELNGSISDADLDASINLIRNRATNNNPALLPPLSNNLVTANGLDMRTEIRRARTVELAFEGFHYWDIIRWKTAENILPNTLLGPKYFPNEMKNVPSAQYDPNGFVIIEDASKRAFNPARDYLWPLPTKELGLNAKLTQNPNW